MLTNPPPPAPVLSPAAVPSKASANGFPSTAPWGCLHAGGSQRADIPHAETAGAAHCHSTSEMTHPLSLLFPAPAHNGFHNKDSAEEGSPAALTVEASTWRHTVLLSAALSSLLLQVAITFSHEEDAHYSRNLISAGIGFLDA